MTIVDLGPLDNAFTQGGNRLCFSDPRDAGRCIKVLRPDRLPAIKRAKYRFPRNLKPLHYFDDNWQELRIYQQIERLVGEAAFQLIPRCFGMVDTNHGPGLVSEMITDSDGRVSLSLKQCVWQQGREPKLMAAVHAFIKRWGELGMPSRNLLLHNIVVQQQTDDRLRLVVIDGLGWPDLLPLANWLPSLARAKAQRKAERLLAAIDNLINNQKTGKSWGYHGWLEDDQRQLSKASARQSEN
ncbi:YrbL family protein [Halioxenophilus sp. WMMB6]|uniref:YrbL family protein n=1 Tax=Halioxenophilus sp. WMMB6 TaxID=3073815 RepID=UPI00295F5407|nr:YrbL family protein [Halioxenophilus sp. WMMB6]